MRRMHGRARLVGALLLAAAVAGCSSGGSDVDPGSSAPTPMPTSASVVPRIPSPAVVEIVEPKSGATVAATGTVIEVSLAEATLTDEASQDITPTEGHLHVSLDGELISMTSGLTQTLPDLEPGRHTLRVEFVALDHLPFDPRVVTQAVFEVR